MDLPIPPFILKLMKSLPIPLRIQFFLIVGGTAFCVQWLLVFGLVNLAQLTPLIANVIAFPIAFQVSYFGHKNITFDAREQAHATASVKFLIVALTGFAVNESVYAFLLKILHLHYLIGLPVAVIAAAVTTYVLSKTWAFKGKNP